MLFKNVPGAPTFLKNELHFIRKKALPTLIKNLKEGTFPP